MVTKDEVYSKNLVCKMWATFGKYASEHDYKPWKNAECTGLESKLGVKGYNDLSTCLVYLTLMIIDCVFRYHLQTVVD